jgi:CRP-like cAMP-binding protein
VRWSLVLGQVRARLWRRLEWLRAARLLPADDVDGSPVDDGEDPGARLGPLRNEARGRPPDGEKSLLDGVFGQCGIANYAQGETVGDVSKAVVELRKRAVISPRDERDERLIGEMSEVSRHRSMPPARRPAQR